MGKYIEIIGNKYNKLTPLYEDVDRWNKQVEDKVKNKLHYYFCECDCNPGIVLPRSIQKQALLSGHIKSCGCLKFNNPKIVDDITGKTFGRLTVIERDIQRDLNSNSNVVHWLCKCSCEKERVKSVSAYQLKSGKTKSCGCLQSEVLSERNKRDSKKINRVFIEKTNQHEDSNSFVRVFNNETQESFIVDKDDYTYIKRWYWRKDKKGYWVTNAKLIDKENGYKTSIKLHQVIAERKYGKYKHDELFPDHLSRDKNDNRKCNLELKTNIDNMKNRSLSIANTSGKTGVYVDKSSGKYIAAITVNYKTITIGRYSSYDDAVSARKEAEEKYGFTCDDVTAATKNQSA